VATSPTPRHRARRRGAATLDARSPLATWAPGEAGLTLLRRRLGQAPLVLRPRDRHWRHIAPGWADCLALIRSGLPFHVVAERRYDRSSNRRRLAAALASGATVYVPQAHEVLPRVARLMVAIRASLLDSPREECSFLFLVEGRAREAMGLHHDGPADAFWLQLEGRRRVTVGPPVSPRTAQDLDTALADRGGRGWTTFDLAPGTLFYLPPFTPHRVLCPGRSLALSLTWAPARRPSSERARLASLAAWPVASGRALAIPQPGGRYWTQVPAVAKQGDAAARGGMRGARSSRSNRGSRSVSLLTPSGHLTLPASARALVRPLSTMSSFSRSALGRRHGAAVERLLAHGVLDTRDLPLAIRPADPAGLDGWRFG
jgi:hypothetical protein